MPGSRNGIVYTPWASDFVSLVWFVATFVALMLALGTAAPLGSVTVPVTVARKSCPNAHQAPSKHRKHTHNDKRSRFITITPLLARVGSPSPDALTGITP